MEEKLYKCAYTHCLHGGEPVSASAAIVEKGKKYHWDCLDMKHQLAEIRKIYLQKIDQHADFRVLGKVLNDLVFKYEIEVDFIRFCLEFYVRTGVKIKSPFSLLYIRDNKGMRKRWEKTQRSDEPF